MELTVALHYVFDTPHDRLIWDVGHQAYPHKILTGRRDRIRTLRQAGGLSGFTKRAESVYDPFGAAHASTSISAGLGMAVARDLQGGNNHVIAVIGDGSLSAGMAYEAMNNAGAMNSRLIVILNDNDMSISPPVGAMSAYLARVISGNTYQSLRGVGKHIARHLPKAMEAGALKAEAMARNFLTGGTLFEELGFLYVGPIDGHNLEHLLPVLKNARDADDGPILIHVVTQKGKGYPPAEAAEDKYHGVVKFDVVTGKQQTARASAPSYTKVFGQSLVKEAQKDDRIVAITAAMPSGTGLDLFAKRFPKRCFDVGIAEQHAVTFAAGLAAEGYKPFAAIYLRPSLQRAAMTRWCTTSRSSGCRCALPWTAPGSWAPTDRPMRGSFDVAYLGCLPNFVIMAAADEGRARCTWWRRRPRSTTARRHYATRAVKVSACRCRKPAFPSRSARDASYAREPPSRCSRLGRAFPSAVARRTSSRCMASPARWPMRDSQSRSISISSCGSRASTRC